MKGALGHSTSLREKFSPSKETTVKTTINVTAARYGHIGCQSKCLEKGFCLRAIKSAVGSFSAILEDLPCASSTKKKKLRP